MTNTNFKAQVRVFQDLAGYFAFLCSARCCFNMDDYYEDYDWSEELYESDVGQEEARRSNKRRHGIVIRTSGSSDEDEPREGPRVPLKSLPAKTFYPRGKSSSISTSRKHKRTRDAYILPGDVSAHRTNKENRATKQLVTSSASVDGRNSSSDEITKSTALQQLEKTNKLLGELIDRVKSTENRLKGLEEKYLSSLSSSSSSSTPKRSSRKKDVPREIRVS